jgi:hypothetical protein
MADEKDSGADALKSECESLISSSSYGAALSKSLSAVTGNPGPNTKKAATEVTIRAMENTGPVRLRYYNLGNLGSRGGVVRFFFLYHGINHTNEWLALGPEWTLEKQRLIATGESPGGYIPVVYDGDKTLTEHHSIVRYYAKKVGVYGKDDWADFVSDNVAESTKEWRASWVAAVVGDDANKATYAASLPARYTTLEALLKKYKGLGTHFSVGDAVIFGQVYDDRNLGQKVDLSAYPHINDVVTKALKNEPVKKWCDEHGKPF